MTDYIVERLFEFFLAIGAVTIAMWIIVGSTWLLFSIDEIMQRKLPKYKKWHDECANDL